jgi:hypothetical protein
LLTAKEGWAVGTGTSGLPTILRWDGTLWALVPSGTAVENDPYNHIDAAIADSGFPNRIHPNGTRGKPNRTDDHSTSAKTLAVVDFQLFRR